MKRVFDQVSVRRAGVGFAVLAGGTALLSSTFSARSTSPSYAQSPTLTAFRAICVLNPDGNSGVKGVVRFRQTPGGPLEIDGKIENMADGAHGFHVHEFGNLTQGCTSAGGHFNPLNVDHGGPNDKIRHIGDLGNITSKAGVAEFSIKDTVASLTGGYSIVGRSLVVHKDTDDLGRGGFPDSKTTGHAGARLACGVIGLDKPETK